MFYPVDFADREGMTVMLRSGKERATTRAILCYLAVRDFGYTGKEAGTETGLGSAGVSIAIRRGEALLKRARNFEIRLPEYR